MNGCLRNQGQTLCLADNSYSEYTSVWKKKTGIQSCQETYVRNNDTRTSMTHSKTRWTERGLKGQVCEMDSIKHENCNYASIRTDMNERKQKTVRAQRVQHLPIYTNQAICSHAIRYLNCSAPYPSLDLDPSRDCDLQKVPAVMAVQVAG